MFFRDTLLMMIIFFITVALSSCDNDKNDTSSTGRFKFSLKNEDLLDGSGQMQTTSFVLFSIETVNGDHVYTLEKSALHPSHDGYKTDPIYLPAENYTLVEFFVLGRNEEVLFASPRSGSALAELIKNPLSVPLQISANHTTSIVPEIVTTDNSLPQDFGYSTFGFEETEVITMGVAAYIPAENDWEIAGALLKIEAMTANQVDWWKEIQLKNDIATISVKGGYDLYRFTVTREDYKTSEKTYTSATLRETANLTFHLHPVLTTVRINFGNSVTIDSAHIIMTKPDVLLKQSLVFENGYGVAAFDLTPGEWRQEIMVYESTVIDHTDNNSQMTTTLITSTSSINLEHNREFNYNGPYFDSDLDWDHWIILKEPETGVSVRINKDPYLLHAELDLNGRRLSYGYLDRASFSEDDGTFCDIVFEECFPKGGPGDSFCERQGNIFDNGELRNCGPEESVDSMIVLTLEGCTDDIYLFYKWQPSAGTSGRVVRPSLEKGMGERLVKRHFQ